MADSNRSSASRAAELAAILAQYCASLGVNNPPPFRIAAAVMAMQKAARSAKRACSYSYRDDAAEARATKRQVRAQDKLAEQLAQLTGGVLKCRVELGGDPRGPCATLHIPGQRGDGWGDGYGIY